MNHHENLKSYIKPYIHQQSLNNMEQFKALGNMDISGM